MKIHQKTQRGHFVRKRIKSPTKNTEQKCLSDSLTKKVYRGEIPHMKYRTVKQFLLGQIRTAVSVPAHKVKIHPQPNIKPKRIHTKEKDPTAQHVQTLL